jgi:hypothetical protein
MKLLMEVTGRMVVINFIEKQLTSFPNFDFLKLVFVTVLWLCVYCG